VTEHHGLPAAPVFVIYLRAVFSRDSWHDMSPLEL
jgi:hypothetical protein